MTHVAVYSQKDLVIQSHNSPQLPMPPISPENITAHISSTVSRVLEVGKTSQEVPVKSQ